jgi:hypothetical protein
MLRVAMMMFRFNCSLIILRAFIEGMGSGEGSEKKCSIECSDKVVAEASP